VPVSLRKTILGTQQGISTKRKPSDKLVVPQRKSRRLQGKLADERMMKNDKLELTADEMQFIKQETPARFGAHLAAEALNVDGSQGQQFLASIVGGEEEEREKDLRVDAQGVDVMDYSLQSSDIVKAVEERIYAIAFHPRRDRVVVACGDKRGNLALWNADAPDSDESVVAMYRPHTLPTTQLHFQPGDATKLLSASFDGTVRQLDLHAAQFTELFATDDHAGITSMALGTQPGVVLASGDDGHVWTIDTRQAPATHTAYEVHEKKVQTVHQHPLIDLYVVYLEASVRSGGGRDTDFSFLCDL
jgi:WD40 repeat protein